MAKREAREVGQRGGGKPTLAAVRAGVHVAVRGARGNTAASERKVHELSQEVKSGMSGEARASQVHAKPGVLLDSQKRMGPEMSTSLAGMRAA